MKRIRSRGKLGMRVWSPDSSLAASQLQPTAFSASAGNASELDLPRPSNRYSLLGLVFRTNFTIRESGGTGQVDANNPKLGGGLPLPVTFQITQGAFVPNPFLISLTPDTVASGGPSFTLIVNGTNFEAASLIIFNSIPLVTTFVNQLMAVVASTLIRTPGKKPVTVTNSGNGGTSNRLFVEVQ